MILWPVAHGDVTPFASVLDPLRQDYELVSKSRPLGLAYLYRRRQAGASRPADDPGKQ